MTEQGSSSGGVRAPAPRSWSPKDAASTSLDSFLKKYKPSTTKASTTEPDDGWIWVHGTRDAKGGASKAELKVDEAIEKGTKWLQELAAKCKAIEDDDSIPVRASKAKGASKKQRKEHAQREADLKNKLRQLGIDAGMDCGKWLFYRNGPALDGLFSSLAHSIVDGPLSKLKTPVITVKVATVPEKTPMTPQEGQQQVICVYFLDFWNPTAAKEVLECLLMDHGAVPSSCKSDLYTHLHIASNHPSGLRSTEYQPKELIDPDEIEAYVEAYKAGKQTVKVRSAVRDFDEDDFEAADDAKPAPKKAKSASPVKEKSSSPVKTKTASPAKSPKKQAASSAAKAKAEEDDGSVTEDDEEEAQLRKEGEARKAAKAAAAAASSSSESTGAKRSAPSSATAAPAPKRKPAAPRREQF